MIRFRTSLRTSLRAFAKDESGILLAETLIFMPLLVWGFLALVVYWDVFRTINVTQKAAYSIADLLSRQAVVNMQFINGLDKVLKFLTPGAPDSKMLITSLEYNGTTKKYKLLFSRSPNGKAIPRTEASIQALKPMLPTLADLESVIIVETWVNYEPDFDTGVLNFAPGVKNQTFSQFIVTRPRNWRRVCLDGTSTCS